MDDRVPVVGPGKVGQGAGEGVHRLLESPVPDGVHLDLQPRAVGLAGEGLHLLVRIVQHARVGRIVGIGLRCSAASTRAETAVQGRGEAAADARELPFQDLFDLHRLEEEAVLEGVAQAPGEQALQGHVHVQREPHSAHRVQQADALWPPARRPSPASRPGSRAAKPCLSRNWSPGRRPPGSSGRCARRSRAGRRASRAAATSSFELTMAACPSYLTINTGRSGAARSRSAWESSRRSATLWAEAPKPRITASRRAAAKSETFDNGLLDRFGVADLQPAGEQGVRHEMHVRVGEGGQQGPAAQLDPRRPGIGFRQGEPRVDDLSACPRPETAARFPPRRR